MEQKEPLIYLKNITNKLINQNTMKKVTAVGLLIQNIVEDQTIKAKSMSEWIMVFEKVKEMEKEQIIKAFNEGTFANDERVNAEQYFNETFKK
jgi:hypothetical protein